MCLTQQPIHRCTQTDEHTLCTGIHTLHAFYAVLEGTHLINQNEVTYLD